MGAGPALSYAADVMDMFCVEGDQLSVHRDVLEARSPFKQLAAVE